MIRPGFSTARNAFATMSLRLLLAQMGLAALVFALTVVWLRLSDSSALSMISTVLIGLVLLALASGGEVALMLRICARPLTPARLLKGAVAFLACVALWLLWSGLITTLESRESLLAGYLNSRFPASLRNIFSYAHLHQAMECIASLLRWIGAGILTAAAYSVAASERPRNAAGRVLRSVTYWVALMAGCFIASTFTERLMDWTPGHSLGVEMFSLLFRLVLVTVLDAVIVLFVLAVIAACIEHSDSLYKTPEGGPDDSHPLTAPTP
jgi:hypothetical protein